MTNRSFSHVLRNSRQRAMITLLALVIFGIIYVIFLNHEEKIMERHYQSLKISDPVLYLSEIRQARGFKLFLSEYLDMHDYHSAPVFNVPPFLVGRWSLFDNEKRVGDDFIPDSCMTSLEIEDGRLKLLGEQQKTFPVTYTMTGNVAVAHLDSGEAVRIRVVAYGSHVHHIEVEDLPGDVPLTGEDGGQPSTWYGYLCH